MIRGNTYNSIYFYLVTIDSKILRFDEQKGIAADHRTVIALVFIKSGVLREGTKIQFFHTKKTVIPIEIGILHPEKTSCRVNN